MSYQPIMASTSPYHSSGSYKLDNYGMGQPSPSAMTRSRILEPSHYSPNDHLYNPLKTAVGGDPALLQRRGYEHQVAAQSSLLPTEYRPISSQQMQSIRDNTYVIDQPLRPAHNLQPVQGKHFYVLDSYEKQGTPINEIEFKSRLAASREKGNNIAIYEAEDSPQKPSQLVPVPAASNLAPQRKSKGGKYNLYSCLDQPFERVKKLGCRGLTCPANECVAATEKPYWLN